ncbi:hypothetical protein [Salisediminibacterium halotolerans]|uniref:Thioredoxin n=1 Tax=Salisediminibacterium halotolerans TaxID=517425 RepID=A0A1H9WZ04_9BACI|nr:hypothetical protein [Salisediminibacterium haloalkalitolerans]SES39140.1 hypothetical protein SAMN05444126_1671 [Salisediminibacterium haloalkalitolerans]
MASLKDDYGDDVDFYFIEYNEEDAEPIIEEFNIEQHPETFVFDEDRNEIEKYEGFDQIIENNLRADVEQLAAQN